jgi:PAS domain S-box-containing protein
MSDRRRPRGERRGGERTPSRALWTGALVAGLVVMGAVGLLAWRVVEPAGGTAEDARLAGLAGLATGLASAVLAALMALLLRRSLRALAHSEARYRASFEGAHVGIAHVGLDGRLQRVNRRFREILGHDERVLAGLTFAEVTHPDDRALDAEQVERLVAGAIDGFAVEKRCVRRDGSTAWVSLTVALARDRARRPTHFIAAVEDIAARKVAEADLREAVRIRDEFLQIASHELRTPLTSLRLQIESLQAALDRGAEGDGKLAHKAEAALKQTARLAALVDGLLEVSRLGAEAPALELRDGDVTEVAAAVVARHGPEAARTGTALTLSAAGPARARFDRARLELAIGQLVANAVKYGARKPVEVRVAAEGGLVRIAVRDEGIGVSPEDRERIFDRFARAVPASHYGGLGLGLFLARRVAEAHGGRIGVESAPGEGATFVLELPAGSAAQRPATPAAERASQAAGG